MFWKTAPKPQQRVPQPKIEIFSRHCVFSSISAHKKRFPNFSREACYRNLLNTVDLSRANITFLLDGARQNHFLKEESRFPVIEIQEGSEAGSFLRLLDYVEKLKLHPDTILYFVEDDYLHQPGWIDVLCEGLALGCADYVSLYDHKDKYDAPMYKDLKAELFATLTCHWRTTPSTTQTFAMHFSTLLRDLSVHRRFSTNRKISADHAKFCHLAKKGIRLISSLPGWSTHAEPEFASPCIEWEKSFLC